MFLVTGQADNWTRKSVAIEQLTQSLLPKALHWGLLSALCAVQISKFQKNVNFSKMSVPPAHAEFFGVFWNFWNLPEFFFHTVPRTRTRRPNPEFEYSRRATLHDDAGGVGARLAAKVHVLHRRIHLQCLWSIVWKTNTVLCGKQIPDNSKKSGKSQTWACVLG